MIIRRSLTLFAALALLLGACSSGDDDDDDGAATTVADVDPAAAGEASGTITVHTAPQLADTMQTLGEAFEKENPDATVEVTEREVPDLVEDATSDDPPNVVLAAGSWVRDMRRAGATGLDAQTFGRDVVVIITPEGNPASVDSLRAFGEGEKPKTVACADDTELGNFVEGVLTKAGVTPGADTVLDGCDGVVDKVAKKQLNGALLYRSEVGDRDDVEVARIGAKNDMIINLFHIVFDNDAATAAFVEWIESADGEAARTSLGYLP